MSQPVTYVGFSSPEVCRIANVTYRQIDYWIRTGLITPSICASTGSGSRRLFSERDVNIVCLIASMLSAGLGLAVAREAVNTLRELDFPPLSLLVVQTNASSHGQRGGHLQVESQSVRVVSDPNELLRIISEGPCWVCRITYHAEEEASTGATVEAEGTEASFA